MIYDVPAATDDIRQGDIFKRVPRLDIALNSLKLASITEDSTTLNEVTWKSVVVDQNQDSPVIALVGVRPVVAIVITQDCDAVRSSDIALCEIRPFKDVEPLVKQMKDRTEEGWKPKQWAEKITQHARINQKWFYLPADASVGFSARMGVDFRTVMRLNREELEQLRPDLRVARLKEVPLAHFRERIAEFFRRYPYDEWYPLDKDELKAYSDSKNEPVKPFPWQE